MSKESPEVVREVTGRVEKKFGLPEGLLFKMAHQESRFQSDAVSPKGAKGFFQFMPATAAHYGLKDPTNLEESAHAAGAYMADNMKTYGGDVRHALADYNGGPKAVAALKAGTPFNETSGYLVGILGGDANTPPAQPRTETPQVATVPEQPLSRQFTSGSAPEPTVGPAADVLAGGRARADAESGIGNLPSDLATGFKLDNSVYNYWQTKATQDAGPEQDLTDDNAKLLLGDVPQAHWDYMLQGRNDAERNARKGRVLEALKAEQRLAEHGVTGMMSRMAAGLFDLPTLAMFVPGMSGEGLMTTASRLSNAARMSLVQGVSFGGYEAATYRNRPLGTEHDIYMAAAMGIGMGFLVGGSMKPEGFALAGENRALQDFGRKAFNEGHLKEIEADGMQPTPGYKQFLEGLEKQKKQALQDIEVKLRDWSIDQPKDVNVPVNGPHEFVPSTGIIRRKVEAPETPRAPEAPRAPEDRQSTPPTGKVPEAPPGPNTPRYEANGGLILRGKTIKEMTDYMRVHSKDRGLVTVMERVLKAIDLRKMDFRVLEVGQRWNGRGMDHSAMDSVVRDSRGAVGTPGGSTGEGIKMFLRGESWGPGRHGMSEEIFTHELVHAAAVYKQNAAKYGITMTPQIKKAAKDLKDLHSELVAAARSRYGVRWESELNMRLGANLQNDKELLAYGLTNKPFQEFLKSVSTKSAPDKSLWSRFVTSLREMLGIDAKDHNAFTRLIELSGPLTTKGGVAKSATVNTAYEGVGSIDSATVQAANAADIPVVFGWGLGMEHRLGSASAPAAVRAEAAKLFGTTVGYKGHSVIGRNAWDSTTQLSNAWVVKFRKGTYPQFEEWFKGTKRGFSEKGQAYEEFGIQVSDYIRGVQGNFAPQVTKAGDAIRNVLAEAMEHINNPARSTGGKKLGLTETLIKDTTTGAESIRGTLVPNKNYLPRKHDITKWNSVVNQFGRDAVESWWANAYKAARSGVSDEAVKKWAGWYVRTVEEAHGNRTQDLLGDLMQGQDKEALANSLMRNGGYTHGEAIRIMEDMLPSKPTDAGALQGSLKHRNTIDETYSEKWTTKDGQDIKVSMNDFTHTNALDFVEPYLRRTAGNVALADHLGVYKAGHIAERIAAATENKLGGPMLTAEKLKAMRDDLQFAYDRIQALPQEETSGLNKSLGMWRDFNVIRLMGGTVWNQATEMGQIVGSMGWKTMLKAMPELKALSRDVASGKAPNDILEHLENTIGGVGSEYIQRMEFKNSDDWVRMKGDTAWNRKLDSFDTKLKKFAKGTLDYTGMTGLMIQQKRVHAIALVNHFINDATGKQVSTFLTKDRLAWMGLDETTHAELKAALKKYSSPTKGTYSATNKLDFDAFIKDAPEAHARFMEAIHRESRRVIQENDLASMVPIMGTTLGKTMFQFMNFTMHGWNKSLMFAANHRDFATLSTVLHGGLLASLSYMGRTQLSALGLDGEAKQKFLDERLNTKQIVANSLGRTSQASLLPNLYDSTLGNLTGPMFSGMRTTSDVSSLASNPTLSAVNSTLSLMGMGKNAMDGGTQTTQSDIRKWGKLLPLNNVVPVSTLLNGIANDYPTSAKEE